MNRRLFLASTLTAGAALGSGVFVSGQPTPAPAVGTEPKRKSPIDPSLVKEFVVAGHSNLPRVKEMLGAEPTLINATWDWGAGDYEAAIGGASHLGNRELALHLLGAGARFDAFCAAMLNEADTVSSMLRAHPSLANTLGPHGFTLLYHVGYAGNVALAETVAASLTATNRASHFNQALQTAVARSHTDLVAYLLDHGVTNANSKNFQGKTPLAVALAKGDESIATLLRAHGGVTAD